MHSYRFIIKGKVQKVYYRKTICDNAKKHNFNGYVKNLQNGDVEAAISCQEQDLDIFIKILQKGSLKSKVDTIQQLQCSQLFKEGFIAIY